MAHGVEAFTEGMFNSKEEEEELRKSIYNRQDEGERRKIREGYRNFMDALNGEFIEMFFSSMWYINNGHAIY